MAPTVYIETSVISYYTARPSRDLIVAAHQQITHEWWRKALPRCEPYISDVVLREAERGDATAAERRLDAVAAIPILEVTPDIFELARSYASALKLPEHSLPDAYHLAIASFHGMDILVTWNCRHIATTDTRRFVSAVNLERGIETPDICTPEEAMEFSND